MALLTGTPPRDASGKPVNHIHAAGSPALAGKWFAYLAEGCRWALLGLFPNEAAARRAAGLEEQG